MVYTVVDCALLLLLLRMPLLGLYKLGADVAPELVFNNYFVHAQCVG